MLQLSLSSIHRTPCPPLLKERGESRAGGYPQTPDRGKTLWTPFTTQPPQEVLMGTAARSADASAHPCLLFGDNMTNGHSQTPTSGKSLWTPFTTVLERSAGDEAIPVGSETLRLPRPDKAGLAMTMGHASWIIRSSRMMTP